MAVWGGGWLKAQFHVLHSPGKLVFRNLKARAMFEMPGECGGPACGRFTRMLPVMACDLYVAARELRAVILGCPSIGPSEI